MNLTTLFETQKELDAAIVQKKGLESRDVLPEKILALQTELGECANEWRGFKYWSNDQNPKTNARKECPVCFGTGMVTSILRNCKNCKGSGTLKYNPLLEEYVDCLHFILSIGLVFNLNHIEIPASSKDKDGNVTKQFINIQANLSALWNSSEDENSEFIEEDFVFVISKFIGLGELLGFTWNQIEQAYYDKNKINHTRQATGY